jgi:rhodanese-related sulfurtransferase/polyisoprenoid-binding protein YceI
MIHTPAISPAELSSKLQESPPPILLDVRLEEDHAAEHLPGASNNCVFEVAFLDRMSGLAPDKSSAICVYGSSAGSFESRMAAEKLARAGYTNVIDLREGVAGWKAAGFSVDAADPSGSNATIRPDGRLDIDLAESRIEWLGRNLLNKHWGRIGLKSGWLEFSGGQLCGGEFVIDMKTISCDDLAGSPVHDILIAHLRSDDFFDVDLHPEARVKISSASPIEGAKPGSCNLRIRAELTLKGITKPVDFTASAGITGEGKAAAQASFAIDRTEWNVLYGSGRFFERLAATSSMI